LLIDPNSKVTAQTAWWIVSRVWAGRTEAMTVPQGDGGGELMAVFGHEEEAGMFLWSLGLSTAAKGWRVAETRSGELASVLCGPCRRANGVALDPLPEMHQDGTAALVGVGRERFLACLLERGRPGPLGLPARGRNSLEGCYAEIQPRL
jgi:hypothetical protein